MRLTDRRRVPPSRCLVRREAVGNARNVRPAATLPSPHPVLRSVRGGALRVHLLSGALQASHLAGRPLQYFHHRLAQKYAARYGLDATRNFGPYLRGLLASASTANGVFGFRIESWDLQPLVSRLRATGEFGHDETGDRELLRAR